MIKSLIEILSNEAIYLVELQSGIGVDRSAAGRNRSSIIPSDPERVKRRHPLYVLFKSI